MSNKDGIGGFYKLLGAVAFVSLLGLVALQIVNHHDMNKFDMIVYIGMLVLILALVRPPIVDNIARLIADKLPFIHYTK